MSTQLFEKRISHSDRTGVAKVFRARLEDGDDPAPLPRELAIADVAQILVTRVWAEFHLSGEAMGAGGADEGARWLHRAAALSTPRRGHCAAALGEQPVVALLGGCGQQPAG